MATTTELIKDLRAETGAGVLDCKKALDEMGGDFEKAVEYLRQKGLAAAAKTARTYAGFQDSRGTIYYTNYLDGRVDRSSVCGSAVAFSGIIWLKLKEHGINDFDRNIELSLDWILKNRYDTGHPDPNLAGAVINTRLRHRSGKLWLTQRDIGTSFGTRFLVLYYDHSFGNE